MKILNSIRPSVILLITVSAFWWVACGDSVTSPEEHGALEVTMAFSPDPATVNTVIALTFEVEEGGEHTAVTMFTCEVEKAGTGNHEDMTLSADPGEVGHYIGTRTFTEAGTYEFHFNFMHDNEMEEKTFSMQVQ